MTFVAYVTAMQDAFLEGILLGKKVEEDEN